ncbi:MAG: HPr family phosphocarrier protein [Clostridia bacterium]|nr:HPr family phosphocarrier protein [Clostridia bacterium]
MKTFMIKLSTLEDVRRFVNTVTAFEGEIDLKSGRYTVDAKSIMGIFSLDLLNPVEMTIHCDDCDAIVEKLNEYIIK